MITKQLSIPILASILLVGTITVGLSLDEAFAKKEDKVTICHKPGTPAEQTKEVPESAVKGHLGHGDFIGSCEDGQTPGALDLIEEGTGISGLSFTAVLQESITTCPEDIVCGVGTFIIDPTGSDALMAAVTVHSPFCDNALQDADAAGNAECDDSNGIDDIDAPHGHFLSFDNDSDCESGLALVNEIDWNFFTVNENTVQMFNLRTISGFGPEIHTFTVESGPNGEICPVIVDTVV